MEPAASTASNNNVQQPSSDVTDGSAATSPGTGPVIRPEDTAGPRYGVCKWFNVAKGWGFITPNDGGIEVFVHQSAIQMGGFRSLAEQEEVEFECKVTARGLEATRVSGCQGNDCHGSTYRPRSKRRFRRVRCYNCGEFANHIASECQLGPQPKSCHHCKQSDHLFAECPQKQDSQRSGPKAPARAYSDASNSASTDIR